MARQCPEDSNFNGRPPRRENRHFRQEMFGERVINKKTVLQDPFTGGQFVFPSGRQDFINPRLRADRVDEPSKAFGTQESMEVELATQTKQIIIEIPDSPEREPERIPSPVKIVPPAYQPEPIVVEEKMVKEGFQASRQAVQSRSRSRSKPKQVRTNNADDDSY